MSGVVDEARTTGEETASEVLSQIDRRPLARRLVDAAGGVIVKQSEYRLSLDAAGAAFWLVISVFPAMIAMITMYGLVVDPTKIASDVADIARRSPNSFGAMLATQAQQVAANDAGDLSVSLVASLLVTLWSVSSGGYAMFRAMRQAYGLPPQNYVVARARAFLAAIGAVLLLGIAIGVAALLFTWTDLMATPVRVAALGVAGVVGLVLFTLFIAGAFRYSIAEPTPWRSTMPGAVIGAVVTVLMAAGVALFGSYLTNYQAIYGALTGIIVAMLALYTVMYVLLLCAVFNEQWAPIKPVAPPPPLLPELPPPA